MSALAALLVLIPDGKLGQGLRLLVHNVLRVLHAAPAGLRDGHDRVERVGAARPIRRPRGCRHAHLGLVRLSEDCPHHLAWRRVCSQFSSEPIDASSSAKRGSEEIGGTGGVAHQHAALASSVGLGVDV